MAKARAAGGGGRPPRQPVLPTAAAGGGNYFASVVDELRKVVWPTWDELGRMTGVVITTVVIMAILVSGADYALSFVVRQLYTTSSSSSSTPVRGSTVSAKPSVAASPSAKPSATPAATSTPTTAPTSTPASSASSAPVTP